MHDALAHVLILIASTVEAELKSPAYFSPMLRVEDHLGSSSTLSSACYATQTCGGR